MQQMFSFEKLEVWQNARKFTVRIYEISGTFPVAERFGIVTQVRRAAAGIAANIAEGSGRQSAKDQGRFYTMAYSSALEVFSFILLSEDLHYISKEEVIELRTQLEIITKQISRLTASINPKP